MAIKVRTGQSINTPSSPVDSIWQDASATLTRRSVFVSVFGDTGSGRTTWALTAPGPIALLHTTEKIDGIVQPFYQKIGPNGDGTNGLCDFGGVFSGGQKEIADQAKAKWSLFKTAWYDAFTWARTIIVDTDTEAYQLIRLAYFGGLKPTSGRIDVNYGPVNGEWLSVFKYFRQQDRTNVILIGQTSDEYRESKKGDMGQRTGRTIRSGHKSIPYMSDVIVRTSKEDGVFSGTIEKGWYNAGAEGLQLEDDMSTFPQIMSLITDTDPSEWEE